MFGDPDRGSFRCQRERQSATLDFLPVGRVLPAHPLMMHNAKAFCGIEMMLAQRRRGADHRIASGDLRAALLLVVMLQRDDLELRSGRLSHKRVNVVRSMTEIKNAGTRGH